MSAPQETGRAIQAEGAGADGNAGTAVPSGNAGAPPPVLELELRVANITRQGMHVLERLVRQYVSWHHQTYKNGHPPQVQLLSGQLTLDARRLLSDGAADWVDTVAPAPGSAPAQARSLAGSYELEQQPPAYDRASAELLAAPEQVALGSGALLVGGAEAARRRQMAESCLGESALLGEAPDAAPAATPSKRRKLSTNRCFNCSSYAHSLQECPRPMDEERVTAARAEARAPGEGAKQAAALLKQRYFADRPAGKGSKPGPGRSKYGDLKPGAITDELAQALGMPSSLAPPPWLIRSVLLGVPPRYRGGEPKLKFVLGSDEEEEEQEQEQEEQQQRQQQADSAAAATAAAAAGEAGEQQAAGSAGPAGEAQAAGAAGAAAGADAQNGVKPEQQRGPSSGGSQDGGGGGGGGGQAVAPLLPLLGLGPAVGALVQLPGVNAPAPQGADAAAWQAELDRARAVAARLQGGAAPLPAP